MTTPILAQLLAREYSPLRLRNKSESTRRLYVVTLSNFARFLGRRPTTKDFTDASLSDFCDWHLAKGNSPATANRDLSNLLAMWRWCAQRGTVKKWPEIEMLSEPQDAPQAWMRHELQALFSAIAAVDGWIDGVRARDWWLALHCVLWDSGERIGALLQTKWSWIDLRGKWLTVPALARKGGKRGKVFALHADTVAALRKIQEPPRALVFPWPWNYHYLWQRYAKDILGPAKLPATRKSKFHRMRKTVASFAEAAGLNATELLGHSDRRVTESYLDPRIVSPRGPAHVLFRPGAS